MKTSHKKRKIAVLIPCYNEEKGIAAVIDNLPRAKALERGFQIEVTVIDNNSDDRTAQIARSFGAAVISEPQKGKGYAIRCGFCSVAEDIDYVVMIDGDGTYRSDEILRLVELLDSDFCDVVIGSRLGGRILNGSMPAVNRVGNWIYSFLVRVFYNANVTDVLTGYFAWKRQALERLRPYLKCSGFDSEMEMITKMARLGEEIYCVPISYNNRAGESNLRPFRDGIKIFWMFLKNLNWRPSKTIICDTVQTVSSIDTCK